MAEVTSIVLKYITSLVDTVLKLLEEIVIELVCVVLLLDVIPLK